MDFPISIELKHPIKVGDESIANLTIKRRPITKDLRAMDSEKGEVAKMAALLERLADVPISYIDQMDASDFTNATEIVSSFLE